MLTPRPDYIQAHFCHADYTVRSLASIGSQRRVIVVDNSPTGELDRYARRNSNIDLIRPDVHYSFKKPLHQWEPWCLAHSWNVAIKAAQTPWVVNVNPDIELHATGPSKIEQAIEEAVAKHGEKVGLVKAQVSFNCWAINKLAFTELGGFDKQFWPCAGEDEDMMVRLCQAGWLWSTFALPGWHIDGGHGSHFDDGSSLETFIRKWGFRPHSSQYNNILRDAYVAR